MTQRHQSINPQESNQIRFFNSFFQIISFLLFLTSLTQPGFYTEGARPAEAGPAGWLLVIGWLGYVDNIFAWYANPLLVIAWIASLLNVRRGAILVLPIALTLALSFLLHQEIMNNEAGGHAKIIGRGTGYWLWDWLLAVGLAIGCGLRASLWRSWVVSLQK